MLGADHQLPRSRSVPTSPRQQRLRARFRRRADGQGPGPRGHRAGADRCG
ncbi:hypothetical protein QJS66_07130 [Kocuria rhizophila]|nr:hypothetical protein QJS66_07130 [Kocuria rhizophila]